MCLLDVALLIRNSTQEADLDCHCSCLLYSLASILQWRFQHEEAGADCVVTPSKLQGSLEILESAISNTAHQGCWMCHRMLEFKNIIVRVFLKNRPSYITFRASRSFSNYLLSQMTNSSWQKKHHHSMISTYLWWYTISRRLRLEEQTPESWTIEHHGDWCKTLRLLKYCHLQFWTISHCLHRRVRGAGY